MSNELKRGNKSIVQNGSSMPASQLSTARFHILEIVFAVVRSSFIEHLVDTTILECTLEDITHVSG